MKTSIYDAAEEAFGGDRELQKRVTVSNLTPKQKLVYEAIQDYPQAANDDALLLSVVWQREGWDEKRFLYNNLLRVSRPETLSRRRRELFNLGLIEYSPKAMKSRETAYRNERDKASPIPPQISKYELMTINGERVMKKLDKEELWKKAQKVAKNWPPVTPEQTRMI